MICLSSSLLIENAAALLAEGPQVETRLSVWAAPPMASEVDPPRSRRRSSWDMSFINHCGFWSHFHPASRSSSWPLGPDMTIHEMAWYGTARGAMFEQPQEGDIFFQHSPSRASFVHAGIVASVASSGRFSPTDPYFVVTTIEGDTNRSAQLGGGHAMRLTRRVSPGRGDRFLRWSWLEPCQRAIPAVADTPAIRRAA